MLRLLTKPFGAAAIWMLLAFQTHAQPFFHLKKSIEATVLNADILVVARLVDVAEHKDFYEFTLAVEETLRGEHRKRRTVRLDRSRWHNGIDKSYSQADLAKLTKDPHRFLVATQHEEQPTICGLINLADQELEVWKADLTVLRKAQDVLQVARETRQRVPGVKRTDTFLLTVPIEGGYYGTGGHTRVEVPANERLEKKAQTYVGSKLLWQRIEGVRALQLFQSDANIAGVKALLRDPESTTVQEGGWEVRYYPVREEAFKTLKYWGVNAAMPVIRENVKKLKQATR